MKRPIEIQQEFENLIAELERLKTINELTESNSKNAKSLIAEIEKFVYSGLSFQDSLKRDLEGKTKKFDSSLEALTDSVEAIKEVGEQLQNEINSTINISLQESEKKLNGILSGLIPIIEGLQKNFEHSNNELRTIIIENNKNSEATLNEINDIIVESKQYIKSEIDFVTETIHKTEEAIHSELKEQREQIVTLRNSLYLILGIFFIGILFLIYKSL
jgi:hypothetical protein